MLQALTRRVRHALHRAFEGAGGGRRWEGLKANHYLNAATFADSTQLRKRGRHFAVNNPWVAQGIGRDVAPGGEQ